MTIDQMKKEIIDYGKNLILNSDNQDWQLDGRNTPYYVKNNIRIEMFTNLFCVNVYADNSLSSLNNHFWIYHTWTFLWVTLLLGIFDIEKKNLHKRYKELNSYLTNKKNYDDMVETYNLLPIKEIRKKKIENINNIQEKCVK